jgi:hypothetical protein
MLAAGTPRSRLADARRPCVAAPGSEVSPSHLPQHVVVELLLRQQSLQPPVLLLQRLQPRHILRTHRLVLHPPPLIRLHRNLKRQADQRHVSPLGQQTGQPPAASARPAPAYASCASTEPPPYPKRADRHPHNRRTDLRGSRQATGESSLPLRERRDSNSRPLHYEVCAGGVSKGVDRPWWLESCQCSRLVGHRKARTVGGFCHGSASRFLSGGIPLGQRLGTPRRRVKPAVEAVGWVVAQSCRRSQRPGGQSLTSSSVRPFGR